MGSRPDAKRLLGIYLDDHLAVIAGGEELVNRTLRESQDERIRGFLQELLPELRDDRAAVAELARSLGRKPSALKQRLAWLGEKAGRLKLNGNATGYSPLSRLLELEGIAGVLGASRALWRALAAAGTDLGRQEAAERAARAGRRLEQAEELRLAAAEVVFTGSGRRL